MAKNTTDASKAAEHLKSKSNGGAKHLVILMDESGSMAGLEEAVTTGCNEFLHSFRKDKVLVTLAWFDAYPGEPKVRFKAKTKPIGKVKSLKPDDYRPRGRTPLNDAIMETISTVDKTIDSSDDTTVFMAIITDGFENASEADAETVRKLISKRERKDGWGFVYLGANQQAEDVVRPLGLDKKGKAFNFAATPGGMRANTSTAAALAHSRMAAPSGLRGMSAYESAAEDLYDKTGGKIPEEDEE